MIKTSCHITLVATALTLLGVSGVALPSPATAFPAANNTPLERSTEPSERAAKKGKDKFELVEFKTGDKQTIHARFYAPHKSGRAPAALLVHGADSDAASLDKIAVNLQRKGFAVLVPNLRGHGASACEKCNWSKTVDADIKTRIWSFAVRDLAASTQYLRNLKSVMNSNLTLVGVGAGALLATRYAVQDENARALALIAPDSEEYGFDILSDFNALGGLPVLIMSESKDRKNNTRLATACAKSNDGIEFIQVKSLKVKKNSDVLADKRLATEITKFLQGEAMPKR